MTAHWEMIFDLLSSVPTLISVPILGSLSDKIGRKPVMMIPIISTIISIGSVLIIAEYNLNLWVLALVKFLTGLMGSYSVLIIASFAYISDVTTVDERTSMFVLVEASFFLAFTIGPVLGGYLARTLTNGVIGVFHLTLFLEALVLFYIAIILSESLPKKIQSQNNQQRTCGKMMVSALKSTFSIFSTSKSASHNLMLLVMFAMGLCSGATGCFFLWAAFKFGWDSYDQGIYLFVSSLARMLAMVSLSPLLKTCLKNPIVYDIRVLQGSMLVTMISNVLLAFSTRGWMLIATSLLEGFGALATPTLRALLSKTVSADAQGSLFSGIQVIQQIGSIVSSSIFPNVWAGTVGTSFSSLFLFIQAFVSF
jgi:DHA1 family tetracycline resistance protein-like MFS transporter